MELNIENKAVIARIDRIEDYIENKLCKVVIQIIQQEEVEGNIVNTGYNIVEAFPYDETWEDSQVMSFAIEKVNKRFKDMELNAPSESSSPNRRASVNIEVSEEIIPSTQTVNKPKISLFKRFINWIKSLFNA